jgi:hypothetical protein
MTPTTAPSPYPTFRPSAAPSVEPTGGPTPTPILGAPTPLPTSGPTSPTVSPTRRPTGLLIVLDTPTRANATDTSPCQRSLSGGLFVPWFLFVLLLVAGGLSCSLQPPSLHLPRSPYQRMRDDDGEQEEEGEKRREKEDEASLPGRGDDDDDDAEEEDLAKQDSRRSPEGLRRVREYLWGRLYYGGAGGEGGEGAGKGQQGELLDVREMQICPPPSMGSLRVWAKDLWFHVRNSEDYLSIFLADRHHPLSLSERIAVFWFVQCSIYIWAILLHLVGRQDFYGVMFITVVPLVEAIRWIIGRLYAHPVMLNRDTDMDSYLLWRRFVTALLLAGGFLFLVGATSVISQVSNLTCGDVIHELVSTYFVGFFFLGAFRALRTALHFVFSASFTVMLAGVPVLEVGTWRKQLIMALFKREIELDSVVGQRLVTALATSSRRTGHPDEDERELLQSEAEEMVYDLGVLMVVRHVLRGRDEEEVELILSRSASRPLIRVDSGQDSLFSLGPREPTTTRLESIQIRSSDSIRDDVMSQVGGGSPRARTPSPPGTSFRRKKPKTGPLMVYVFKDGGGGGRRAPGGGGSPTSPR